MNQACATSAPDALAQGHVPFPAPAQVRVTVTVTVGGGLLCVGSRVVDWWTGRLVDWWTGGGPLVPVMGGIGSVETVPLGSAWICAGQIVGCESAVSSVTRGHKLRLPALLSCSVGRLTHRPTKAPARPSFPFSYLWRPFTRLFLRPLNALCQSADFAFIKDRTTEHEVTPSLV